CTIFSQVDFCLAQKSPRANSSDDDTGSNSVGSPSRESLTSTPVPAAINCSGKGGELEKPSIDLLAIAAINSGGCIGGTTISLGPRPPSLATIRSTASGMAPTALTAIFLPFRTLARSASGALGSKCAASATSLRMTTDWPDLLIAVSSA